QFHDLDGSPLSRLSVSPQWHSNGYESDGSPPKFYNNLMYNLNIDFNSFCINAGGIYFYNNVLWNSKREITFNANVNFCGGGAAADITDAFNNTISSPDSYGTTHGSFSFVTGNSTGNVSFTNNISIVSGINTSGTTIAPVLTTNLTMSSTEASTYGF